MKNLTKRQKQSIETKLKITKIATELFKDNGFENVKIQDICSKSNISIGAFYHHFKSKSDIINIGYQQIDLLVKEKLKSKNFDSYLDKIIFMLGEGCDLLENLGYVFVSDVYKNLLHIDNKYAFDSNRFVTLEIKAAIIEAIKSNELVDTVSPKHLTETLLKISRGAIFDWCLHNGSYALKSSMIFDLELILSNYKKWAILNGSFFYYLFKWLHSLAIFL